VSALRLIAAGLGDPGGQRVQSAAQDGYRRGLRAGANLVTINLTPTDQRGDYVHLQNATASS